MNNQLSLLDSEESPPDLPPGLIYEPAFITQKEADGLLHEIDSAHEQWLNDLSRRVQHYGYKYDYMARRINQSMRLGPLPVWVQKLGDTINSFLIQNPNFTDHRPFDQAIINEYQPGQGISAHIDCEPCFGPVVATLSLGSTAEMQFDHVQNNDRKTVLLEERSLAILTNETRYEWQHSIPSRKSDPPLETHGKRILRKRRVSITYRTVIL